MWSVGIRLACVYYILVLCFEQSRSDYCTIECKSGPHTMCEYSNEIGSACQDFDEDMSTLSLSDKEEILEVHNKYRSTVASGKETRSPDGSPQPSASDMMELVWNLELEEISTRWARQCTYAHDKCRKTENGESSGQNIGISSNAQKSVITSVDNWFAEAKDFEQKMVASFPDTGSSGPKIGHYTQGVWSTLRRVGCGKAVWHYPKYETSLSRMIVCNYGPGGNVYNTKVYTEGPPCSACPDGLKCSSKYPGLCANPEKSDFGINTAVKNFHSGLTVFFTLLPIINGFLSAGSLA